MKKQSFAALALCGAMTLTLAACGPKTPETTPTPDPDPTPSMNVVTPEPTEPDVTATPEPTESMNIITPEESETPVVKPLETQTPSKAPDPTPAPTEEPEAPAALTAADIYSKVSAVCGGNPMSDMGFVLEEFYNLSASDLEDFVFYMPEMSATTEEIFIAKVKSGNLDSIKTACESRHQGLKEEGSMYPTAAVYVENAKIVTNGDWIMFAVAADSDAAVTAFNNCF